ncbi:MAG: hypothetical protein R3Y63_14515 [Eubacteriales bacterium]
MYKLLLAEGLSEEDLQQCMNLEYKQLVTELLKKENWNIKGEVAFYQDYENPHLWNVYDSEPESRPTKWTFNTETEQLQKRV